MKTVLVLGAMGGVGRATAKAFVRHGWRVMGLVRPGRTGLPEGVIPVTADLGNPSAVMAVTGPVDVVFNGLNIPYPEWSKSLLALFTQAADLAEYLNARHVYPGSVYNFGARMPAELLPSTPFAPTTKKGHIRVAIEAMLKARADAGRLKTIVIRAGDFFGAEAKSSWMHALVAKDLKKGTITAPGRYDTIHAWACLPDLAEVIVRLAEAEARLGAYEVFHFESHNVTMRQLAKAGEMAAGGKVRLKHMPRFVFHAIGLFSPFMREAIEMLYLWDVPHALKDDRLETIVGPLPRTPLADALENSLQ
jgi:nucleoside-diphosphate-sugar epimerase